MTSPLGRIADLAAWLSASGLHGLELDGPDGRVRLLRGRDGVAQVPPADGGTVEPEIARSGGVGHVLLAHPLRAELLAAQDRRVAAGQVVALLRVGALLLPVRSPCAGIAGQVLTSEGALVGYGDALMEIWPEEGECGST